jgi:diacylglycerol kinase family enzyme
MAERRYHVVMNPNAGTALAMGLDAEALAERFAVHGQQVSIDANIDLPLTERVQRALESEADVIIAAGGDGTATALAESLVGTSKTLGILPLGTANLMARDLSVPLDLDEALEALLEMRPRLIDVGEVNGRIFLHKVVVGFVPAIAAGREHIRGRTGLAAQIGFFRYFLRRLARAKRMALEIAPGDGQVRVERVQAVAVANNSYDEGFGHVFSRPRLDAGHLSLYIMRHITLRDVVRLSAEMLLGRWQDDEALQIETVNEVTLRTTRTTIMVMIDGEVESMTVPLRFRIRPLALSVLAPVPGAAVADDTGTPAAERI